MSSARNNASSARAGRRAADRMPSGALPAAQRRSVQTTRRIAAMLEELLKEKTFERITMAELAAAAHITPGAIYRRFRNKEALLPHIFARYREELSKWTARVTVERMAAAGDLRAGLEMLVRETYGCFAAQAHIFRTVHLYGRLHPDLAAGGSPGAPAATDFAPIGGLLKVHAGEVRRPTQMATQMLGHTLLSSCIERALYAGQNPTLGLKLDDEAYVRALAGMFHAWLTQPRRDPASPSS